VTIPASPGDRNGVISMVYIPMTNSIACIDTQRKVTYIKIDNMAVEKQLEAAYDGALTCICLNEQRHEIAVGDEVGEIKVFSNLDGKMIFLDQMIHASAVTSLAYSPDGTRLISGDNNGKILIWNVNYSG